MYSEKTLVVVDDDLEFQQALIHLLKEQHPHILNFQTGEEAIEFFRAFSVHPDLIVLDVELKIGGLSGIDVAHQLRTQMGLDSPIVFLSAEPHVEVWTKAIPGSRALSKQNSFRRIAKELTH